MDKHTSKTDKKGEERSWRPISLSEVKKIVRVARTAADIAGSAVIRIEDLSETTHYRILDREGWAG